MAEQALYGNTHEPPFPFERIKEKLQWLPAYLSENIRNTAFDLDPLLNTILVFARARTSTLQHIPMWTMLDDLLRRLNAAAASVGAGHHRVELVPRGRGQGLFVTCRRSPRFNWTLNPSHLDVGRNLDFFAPGHWDPDPLQRRCSVQFVEKGSLQSIMAETVLLKYLKDQDTLAELHKFNRTRGVV